MDKVARIYSWTLDWAEQAEVPGLQPGGGIWDEFELVTPEETTVLSTWPPGALLGRESSRGRDLPLASLVEEVGPPAWKRYWGVPAQGPVFNNS